MSVKWHPEEEEGDEEQSREDLVDDLDHAFFQALQQLLDWDSQGMSTEVVVGSKDIFEQDGRGGGGGGSSIGRSGRSGRSDRSNKLRRRGGGAGHRRLELDHAASAPASASVSLLQQLRHSLTTLTTSVMAASTTTTSSTTGQQRRLKKLAVWDSFTLGVWTTAPGSLGEVSAALELVMTNQSILLE